jgi:hypothetical protein
MRARSLLRFVVPAGAVRGVLAFDLRRLAKAPKSSKRRAPRWERRAHLTSWSGRAARMRSATASGGWPSVLTTRSTPCRLGMLRARCWVCSTSSGRPDQSSGSRLMMRLTSVRAAKAEEDCALAVALRDAVGHASRTDNGKRADGLGSVGVEVCLPERIRLPTRVGRRGGARRGGRRCDGSLAGRRRGYREAV